MTCQRSMLKYGLFILLSFYGYSSGCIFNVTVTPNLRLNGFHRNMTYDVNFILSKDQTTTMWPYTDCLVGLHQPLPAGIYANPDELNDLRRTHGLNAVTKKTNIELPAENSEPNIVYIIKKPANNRFLMWVPLHARYHKAVYSGGYVPNEIVAPRIFMRCPHKKLDDCQVPLTPAKFLCTEGSKEKCNWKTIPALVTRKIIEWRVPVGDLNHYYPVAYVTAAVVMIGSFYLIISIEKYRFVLDY